MKNFIRSRISILLFVVVIKTVSSRSISFPTPDQSGSDNPSHFVSNDNSINSDWYSQEHVLQNLPSFTHKYEYNPIFPISKDLNSVADSKLSTESLSMQKSSTQPISTSESISTNSQFIIKEERKLIPMHLCLNDLNRMIGKRFHRKWLCLPFTDAELKLFYVDPTNGSYLRTIIPLQILLRYNINDKYGSTSLHNNNIDSDKHTTFSIKTTSISSTTKFPETVDKETILNVESNHNSKVVVNSNSTEINQESRLLHNSTNNVIESNYQTISNILFDVNK